MPNRATLRTVISYAIKNCDLDCQDWDIETCVYLSDIIIDKLSQYKCVDLTNESLMDIDNDRAN